MTYSQNGPVESAMSDRSSCDSAEKLQVESTCCREATTTLSDKDYGNPESLEDHQRASVYPR